MIEILIGLIVLSIGFLATAGLQITAVKGNSFSDHLSQASVLSQDRLEFLKSLSFSHPALSIGQYDDPDISIRGTLFSRHTSIFQDPSHSEMRLISVTVSWRDSIEHRVSFSTIRSP